VHIAHNVWFLSQPEEERDQKPKEKVDKAKPNFKLSGKLSEEAVQYTLYTHLLYNPHLLYMPLSVCVRCVFP
jgi:hypothetical protein